MTAPGRLALINPNTDRDVTRMMVATAQACAGGGVTIEGHTAAAGASLITTEAALARGAAEVARIGRRLAVQGYAGILIAAFGDPGLARLRAGLRIPVTGIAEAGMAEAAAGGRAFSVVTTTPSLRASIERTAQRYGHAACLRSIRVTPEALMSDPERLLDALRTACFKAAAADGAEAVVIGGGPLASAARAIAPDLPVLLVEPVAAGMRLAAARLRQRVG